MLRKFIYFGLLGALFVAGIGCGGGGFDAESANPDGAFTMSMDPTADGEISRHFAMEIESSAGTITSGFARFVNDDLIQRTTTNVVGETSQGLIDLVATFEAGHTIEIQAEFDGSGWNGSFVRRIDGNIVESGDLDITRGDATANVAANWEGDIDVKGVLFASDLSFEQKGHFFAIDGTIDGDPVTGFGSIVGRSVHFEIIFNVDGVEWLFLGNVNGSVSRMTGVGKQPLDFTFDFAKQPVVE